MKGLSPTPDALGNVRIEGRFEGNAAAFDGYVNQGRFGVERCQVDPSVGRPDFQIACHVASVDATAWLPIVYVVVEATSVDMVDLSAKFLSQLRLEMEIGATHYKPPGAAWAQLVIFVIYDAAAALQI